MSSVTGKKKPEDVVNELNRINSRVETILREIPTSDHRKIGELYTLISRQSELMETEVFKESGTMFLDRAKRIANFLRREYLNALYDGKLRLSNGETNKKR